jgi:hypothetical protein
MADQAAFAGRLIAVDGSRGKDVARAAADVVAALRDKGVECAVSRWDASGLFNELAAGRGDRHISARTLSLVYAADLAFRLRWEIRPVLESGGTVVAAPYLDTAIALAAACGLDDRWMHELLRFAPPPQVRVRAEEKKIAKSWKRRVDRGYAEYAAALLDRSATGGVKKSTRRKMMARLDQSRHRQDLGVSRRDLAALVKLFTDSRPDGPSRASSRPRSARK